MTDELKQTIRIVRKKKVTTDERGRTVWNVPVEETELELVSTTMLKSLLTSKDTEEKLAQVAAEKQGVLAQNLSSGSFEIIDDEDLKAALASAENAEVTRPTADVVYEAVPESDTGEELSLVSTQMLKQILCDDEAIDLPDEGGGFDPYNTG